MAIELTEANIAAVTAKVGSGSFTLSSGQVLKIETSPGGAEILDEVVPSGQQWTVTLNLRIIIN